MELTSINPNSHSVAASAAKSPEEIAQRRQVARAAKTVNASGTLGGNQIVISVDRATRRPIIRVENRDTHEVLLQIPADYVLQLAQNLGKSSAHTTPPVDDM